MEAERALNNMIGVLADTDASFTEMYDMHRQSVAYAKKHGHRSDAQLSREVLFAFLNGDWDAALANAEEFGGEGIWGAGREQNAAMILVAREGLLPAHLARAEAAYRRLLTAGDRQWLGVAAVSATTFFAAERWAETIEHAESGYDHITRGDEHGVPVVQSGMIAARAAKMLGDRGTETRWLAALAKLEGTAGRRAGALFARAMLATPAEAIDQLRAGLELLKDRPAMFAKVVTRQELIERLVAAGHHEEAARTYGDLVEFWQRAGATWYLGRLEAWARDLGVTASPL